MGSIFRAITSKLKWKLLAFTMPVIVIAGLFTLVMLIAAATISHSSSPDSSSSSVSVIPGPIPNLPISKMGLVFIEKWEGGYADWYDDGYGNMTIGYGHTGALPAGYTAPLTIGPGGTAEKLLIYDLGTGGYCSSVQKEFQGVKLSQNQMDALVSLAYNIGGNDWDGLSLTQAIKEGASADIITTDFEKICYAGTTYSYGLYRRRAAEAELYTHNIYTYP